VRDVRAVNLSLLAKWIWRLLNDENSLWKDVLVEKYGRSVGGLLVEEEYGWPPHVSRWWRDLVTLDDSNWFSSEIIRKVGNGRIRAFGRCLGGEKLLSGTNIQDSSLYRLKKRHKWGIWGSSWQRRLSGFLLGNTRFLYGRMSCYLS